MPTEVCCHQNWNPWHLTPNPDVCMVVPSCWSRMWPIDLTAVCYSFTVHDNSLWYSSFTQGALGYWSVESSFMLPSFLSCSVVYFRKPSHGLAGWLRRIGAFYPVCQPEFHSRDPHNGRRVLTRASRRLWHSQVDCSSLPSQHSTECMSLHPASRIGARDPNSGPQACVVAISPTLIKGFSWGWEESMAKKASWFSSGRDCMTSSNALQGRN